MARNTSNSIMVPAIDRGASLRRPVVPGRSLTRMIFFALLIIGLAAAALLLYLNRWRGDTALARDNGGNLYRPLVKTSDQAQLVDDQSTDRVSAPKLDAARLAGLQSQDIDLSGVLATETSAISPSGNFFAICDTKGSITLFDFDGDNKRLIKLPAKATTLQFNSSGSALALGFDSGQVALVDTEKAQVEELRRVHRASVASLTYLEDEGTILSAGRDGYLRRLSAETLVERSRTPFGEPIVDAAASTHLGVAWALGEDGSLRAYALQGMHQVAFTTLEGESPEFAIADDLGLVTLSNETLCVRDPHSLEVNWRKVGFEDDATLSEQNNAVALSDAAGVYIVSSEGGEIVGRRVELGTGIASLTLSQDLSHGLIIDHKGKARGLSFDG